jgi:hypothetical protein
VEPTHPSPVQSRAASVGPASHSVALPALALAALVSHQAVPASLCYNALEAGSRGARYADVRQKAFAYRPLLAQYPALYCHNATRAERCQDALHVPVWASQRRYHLSVVALLASVQPALRPVVVLEVVGL